MTALSRQLIRKTISNLTQGSTLTFRSKIPCSVVFQPEWRDDGIVTMEKNSVQFDLSEKELRTSLGRMAPHICMDVMGPMHLTTTTTIPQITVQVPEKINLHCDLSAPGSCVSIPGKIEGDVVLQAGSMIHAKKLRGHKIDLQATHRIHVSDLIEAASLRVHTSGRFRAKQIHCVKADLQVFEEEDDSTTDPLSKSPENVHYDPDDEQSLVDISALFISTGNDAGSGASIQIHPRRQTPISHRAVRIKSNHGPVMVQVEMGQQPTTVMNEFTNMPYPLVELGGVNGQCEVSVLGSSSSETPQHDDKDWVSCQIHLDSLSTGSVSLVTADCGNVAITVDRKVVADLRLLSHPESSTLLESGSLLAEEEDEGMICQILKQLCDGQQQSNHATADVTTSTKIQLLSPAFTEKDSSFSTHAMEYVEAVVENKSSEPDSRFDRQSGKVRIDGAGSQALSRFSLADGEHAEERPLFAVVGVGNIVLETVSWFGAIARRYGLEESERELGRTASRRGRLLVPPPTTRS